MADTAALIDALKRALRARRINYSQVAARLELSEASVKRLFSRGGFTLERFEEVCALAGTTLVELARETESGKDVVSQLTLEQERAIMRDRRLLLVAVCALNHLSVEEMVSLYELSKAECIGLLLELERIRFLELLPENRIRLRVTHAFTWRPNGPIQQYFKAKAQNEYFGANFDGAAETMLLVNAMLTPATVSLMNSKLRRLANEFAEFHDDCKRTRLGERRSVTLLLALRPWELEDFRELRRPRRVSGGEDRDRAPSAAVAAGSWLAAGGDNGRSSRE
ncbi:MAG: XRE family transcriptional regulator [Betaproteobacteria bacterium]|nr:XRE family transcriptional regulator [Betaproteobacteria bacterium]